jgi:hypothetical protein
MRSLIYVIAIVFAVMVAFASCTKDSVAPVKAATSFHNTAVAAAPDTTGGVENPVPPR